MKHLTASFYLILVCLVLLSCEQSEIQNTSVQEVKSMIVNGHDYTIIDVRTPEEFIEGSIQGATNIDVKADDFLTQLEALNKSDKYLIYCRSGKRSSKAYSLMTTAGFKDVTNMEGGYLAYTSDDD